MTASNYSKLEYMLMLYRTYRLVKCTEKLLRNKYMSRRTDEERRRPEYMNHPTIEEVRHIMRIYTKSEDKKDLVFIRKLKYAFDNQYIEYSRNSSRGHENIDQIRYTAINGERLLEGFLYYGYLKELFRVNNFLVTLAIALLSLLVSIATYVYTVNR